MNEILIPRIFHQVWINKKQPELPQPFARYRDTWLEKHPGWKYKLWNLENLDFPLVNGRFLATSPNFTRLSDLIRFEAVYFYGGVYLDTDFECYKNIEPLLGGVENFFISADEVEPSPLVTGCIGATRKSFLMGRILKHFPRRLGLKNSTSDIGPFFAHNELLAYGVNRNLTEFRSELFYPYTPSERNAGSQYHLVTNGAELFPNAYGAHHWMNSWVEGRSFPPLERVLRKFKLPFLDFYAKLLENFISIKESEQSKTPNCLKGSVWESYLVDAQEIVFRLGNGLAWTGALKIKDKNNCTKRLLEGLYTIQDDTIILEFADYDNQLAGDAPLQLTYRVKLYETIMVWDLLSRDPIKFIKKAPKRIIWHKQPKRWNPETFSVEKI